MGDELIIIIEAYGFTNKPGNWWNAGLSLVEIIGGQLPLSDDEIGILRDSLVEIVPLMNKRWHKLTLKRIYEKGGYQEADECYYEKVNIELVPNRCLTCNSFIDKKESEDIDKYGVDPYCSQYCAEVGNGVI